MEPLIKRLMELGLNEHEAKVYVMLLQKQNYTASELAKVSHTNRTQTYDILARLTKRGMVMETLGSVKKYSAVEPDVVMVQFKEDLNKQKKNIDVLGPALQEIFLHNDENGDPMDFIKVLRTNSSIRDNISHLVRNATDSVMVFNKPPYAMKPDENPDEVESLALGTRHICVYEEEPGDRDAFINKLRGFAAAGEELRIVPSLPLKMILIDDTHAIFTLYHRGIQGTNFTAMTIEHADLVMLLKRTFMLYWNEAQTLEKYIHGGA